VKVLIVTPSYFPIIGGSETLVRTLSTRLNELGIQTDVMAFNMDKKWKPFWSERIENCGNFKIIKIPALNPFPFFSVSPLYYPLRINVLPRLDFKRKFEDYDLIHFLGEADLSLPFFSRSVRKPKIMHVLSAMTLRDQFQFRHATMGKFLVKIFPTFANLLLVFSPEDQQALLDLGVPSDKIVIWQYSVDTDIYRPDETKKQDNLILFVGRLDKVKGLHVLLKSLRFLNLKAQVVVIGPPAESEYFGQIKRMISRVNKEGVHSVKYLGAMDQCDLIEWYQRATVLARPDLVGPSGEGISTLEALACGTPVVGVENHVVRDRINGRIVPPNNPPKFAESLREILTQNELSRKYGKEGRRIIEEEYNLKAALQKLVRIYSRVLSSLGESQGS